MLNSFKRPTWGVKIQPDDQEQNGLQGNSQPWKLQFPGIRDYLTASWDTRCTYILYTKTHAGKKTKTKQKIQRKGEERREEGREGEEKGGKNKLNIASEVKTAVYLQSQDSWFLQIAFHSQSNTKSAI